MPALPILLADVVVEDLEVSIGRVFAGLIVMLTMGGSLGMIISWIRRMHAGTEIFPAARRKPLIVPTSLLFGGIVLTLLMAAMVMASSASDEGPLQPAPDNTEDVSATETEEATDSEEDAGTRRAELSDRMMRTMVDTLSLNLMLFTMFSLVIWLCQQQHSRRLHDADDLSYGDRSLRLFVDSNGDDEASDLEPFDAQQVDQPDSRDLMGESPYAPPNPFLESSESVDGGLESWCLKTELRFAFETFLVAYLPTALLRVLILSLLPESPSHPFLELMEEGVSWSMMLLIGVMAIVVAPLVEELLYRVTILGGCMQHRATAVGWLLSSVLFGFAHGFPDSIALLPLAFAMGYAYIRRRSYRTLVIVHFLFNAFNMLIAGISLI